MNPSPRILGLSSDQAVAGLSNAPSRYSGLFDALPQTGIDVVDLEAPRARPAAWYAAAALAFRTDRTAWRERTGLSVLLAEARSREVESILERRAGAYDAILQLKTLFAPGTRFRERAYALYGDAIYPLVQRGYPAWAPLSRRGARRWTSFEREVVRSARVFFAMSEFLRGGLLDDYGLDPDRVVTVGAGCNSLAPTLEGRRWDRPVALYVGVVWNVKGGPTLLDAWPEVRRRVPAAELWVVGPREPQAPEQPGVRWLGFVGDRTELARLYDEASVFVLPSYFEAWGHVLVEAMGHGLPCIGTRVGAMPELIEDGRSGLLVERGEAEPLAEALVALLGDPARAEALGRRGYDRVVAELTWDHVAARMAPHLARTASGYY